MAGSVWPPRGSSSPEDSSATAAFDDRVARDDEAMGRVFEEDVASRFELDAVRFVPADPVAFGAFLVRARVWGASLCETRSHIIRRE